MQKKPRRCAKEVKIATTSASAHTPRSRGRLRGQNWAPIDKLHHFAGVKVHSSTPSDFLAPMLRSKRSVVARSAPMLFSSCPVDLNPRVERGSVNIFRSVRFWRHSLIAFHTMLSSSKSLNRSFVGSEAICNVQAHKFKW